MASRRSRPTTIAFVRHGVTPTTGAVLPGRAPGLHLSEAGRAQAERLGGQLDGLRGVAAVYASPLERTRETAAPLARALGLQVRRHRGLLECDFGDWTGAKLADLRRRSAWTTVQRSPSTFRFPGGESFTEMQARMTGTVAELVERHPGALLVAVSHADPIKAVVAQALGVALDLFQRIVISPCSVSVVQYSSAGAIVLGVNTDGGQLGSMAVS